MKKLLLPALAVIVFMLALPSCSKDEKVIVAKTVNVQGLFSLTGNWSSLGITSKAALELAADDINAYLKDKNATFRMSVSVSDTKLETETAKTLFNQAKSQGTSFIIGPQSSAELAAIKPLADASSILVVSQSSTAGSLAVAGDAIFRFCPSDKIEGAASGASIYKKGIKGLVTVARDDAGNKGLQTSTGAAFTAKGGEVAALTPYADNTTDFTAVISQIKTELTRLKGIHGAANVGVYLASFDEGVQLMKLAAADATLSNVKWFGGDGVVLSAAFTADAAAAEFVIKTGFFAPSFGLPTANEAQWKPVAARIKAKTGMDPDAFALVAYDALWTIARTLEATGGKTDDFAKVKAEFVKDANKNTGIVGAEALDEAGDRANGTFDYYGITKIGSNYVWTLVGKSDD